MKNKNIFIVFAAGAVTFAACSMDEILPEGGTQTEEQVKETVETVPERVQADVYGLYSVMSQQFVVLSSSFHNDFGYPSQCIAQDLNGPDMVCDNSGFNWYTPSCDWTDRNVNFAIPAFRYGNPYNLIKLCNDVIASVDESTASGTTLYSLGQAKAMRAFGYWSIAPYFQFSYIGHKNEPCIPIVTEKTTDYSNNPRATNEQVYGLMHDDLTDAIKYLEGYSRKAGSKVEIDQQVAYGLRARVNLAMGNYAEAAEDAAMAREGYTPAGIDDVSRPAFCQMSEKNWMWGIQIENTNLLSALATWPSKLSSFSGDSYTAGSGCYKRINDLLYSKIDSRDVRKGWWVDEELKSPLLSKITWNGVNGDNISALEIPNVKVPFVAYTNVKFGMKSGIGSTVNDSDWPLMRVEEMYLIEAEALAKSGHESDAAKLLTEFVSTYRNPGYICSKTGQALYDEIWKERRIELWGEGFSMSDIMRLGKPVVRIHGDKIGYWPEAFAFNVTADDGYMLLRFPDTETNTNHGVPVTSNTEGQAPRPRQNADLTDGVTD